jgi:hypothetical protein
MLSTGWQRRLPVTEGQTDRTFRLRFHPDRGLCAGVLRPCPTASEVFEPLARTSPAPTWAGSNMPASGPASWTEEFSDEV